MATYLELKARAEKLLNEAEEMRQKELEAVVLDIREKIDAYGLTPQDLGFAAGGGRKKVITMNKGPIRYRGPQGQTWSGGRGRKPHWVTEALANGKRLEDFAV